MYWASVCVWLVLTAVAVAGELVTRDYFVAAFGGGGVVALILALAAVNIYWQVGIFCGLLVLLLAVGRPLLKKYLPLKRPQFNFAPLAETEDEEPAMPVKKPKAKPATVATTVEQVPAAPAPKADPQPTPDAPTANA